jgi:hypothetical protein
MNEKIKNLRALKKLFFSMLSSASGGDFSLYERSGDTYWKNA